MRNILKSVNLILLLPCVISTQIQIDISPGTDEKNPDVVVSGSERTNATAADLDAFHITNHEVKANLQRIRWWVGIVNVSHASVHGYRDLHVTLKPKQARIQKAKDTNLQFDQRIIRNKETKPIKVRPEIIQEVHETMTCKWYEQKVVSVGQNILHSLGSDRIEHASAYGQDDSATKAITFDVKHTEEVVLNPGEFIKPCFKVKQTTLEIKIDYELKLDGDLYFENGCVTNSYCFKKNHLDVNEYFKLLDHSPIIDSHEIVTVTYYHDPRVTIGEVYSN